MDGELNELYYDNTKITFSTETNNIETSDELTADPIYQNQMGTKYSRSKRNAGKVVVITGLSVVFTAAAITSGSMISNIFIVSPPTISNPTFSITENGFAYSFSITNKFSYKSTYFIKLDNVVVLQQDCTQAGDYSSIFADLGDAKKLDFYVSFTNPFDYVKTIYNYSIDLGRNS